MGFAMECRFVEQVSLYVDGELDAAKRSRVETHLGSCEACRRARDEFLAVRGRVAGLDAPLDRVAQQRALRDILAHPAAPFWRRRIAVPFPVAASVVVALVAAVVAIGMLGSRAPEGPPAAPLTTSAPAGIDLSRFDRGGRPAVVVRRVEERR